MPTIGAEVECRDEYAENVVEREPPRAPGTAGGRRAQRRRGTRARVGTVIRERPPQRARAADASRMLGREQRGAGRLVVLSGERTYEHCQCDDPNGVGKIRIGSVLRNLLTGSPTATTASAPSLLQPETDGWTEWIDLYEDLADGPGIRHGNGIREGDGDNAEGRKR